MPGTNQSVSWYAGATKLANTAFEDTKGTAFDALDRPVNKYQFVNDVPHAETEQYDQNGYYGEATSHCNYTNQCATTMTYYTTGAIDQVTYNDGTPAETSTYDPDGRLATQQSSAFGTQSYNYDADGRLTSEVEPSGGSVTSPATLTYHYYADGMRSALDVASSALNQASLFAYAYRTDGKLQTQQINYGANAKVGNSALHFVYTNAGKLTQRTESGPAANANAISFQYDGSTGVMTNAIYPAASLSAFGYDAAGEINTFDQNISGGVTNGSTPVGTFTYTNRGELVQDPRASAGASFANGAQLPPTNSGHVETWDARNALMQGISNPYLSDSGGTSFAFDGVGRQTESDQAGTDHYGNSYDVTNSRTYDAENHVLSSAQSSPYNFYQSLSHIDNTLTSYQWGPNGHPIRIGSTPAVANAQPSTSQLAYDTLHWDGGQLLFTTNSAGQVDDIKVGSIGDITPLDSGYSGLTFYDRVAGAIAFCHNATGAAGNDKQNAQHSLLFGTNPATSPCKTYGTQAMSSPASVVWGGGNIAGGVGQGHVLGMPGGDGITDGANTIQGVRSYDSVQGQWTTPDAFAGEVHDPATQKSYMWNGNNAVSYSDPSGYYYGENAGAGMYYDSLSAAENEHDSADDAAKPNKAAGATVPDAGAEAAAAIHARDSQVLVAICLSNCVEAARAADKKIGSAIRNALSALASIFFPPPTITSPGLAGLGAKGVKWLPEAFAKYGKDSMHNVPLSFDKLILEKGTPAVNPKDGYVMMRLFERGGANGYDGYYELGGHIRDGIFEIDHRMFRPI